MELNEIELTYLFKKQNKLNDQTWKTVYTGQDVAKDDERSSVGEGEEDQSNGVETPADLEGEFPAFDVPHNSIKKQANKGHRLRANLNFIAFTLKKMRQNCPPQKKSNL